MIGQQQFKEVLEGGDAISEGLREAPPEQRAALADAWWIEKGVDAQAVDGYAMWEANDSMTLLNERVVAQHGTAAAITSADLRACLAATAEMALRIGWLLREKKYRADLL